MPQDLRPLEQLNKRKQYHNKPQQQNDTKVNEKKQKKKLETAAIIDFSLTSGESRSEGQDCGLHAAELPPPNRSTASFTERNGTELSTSPLPLLFFASSSITPAAEATERRRGGGGGRTFIIITPFSFTQRREAHTQMCVCV